MFALLTNNPVPQNSGMWNINRVSTRCTLSHSNLSAARLRGPAGILPQFISIATNFFVLQV